ncbi:NEAT domain-containing protein [Paenibacillus yanchengensis]|uniref:NEAT domain-containing protein n=1 Tax=Paenibacillus yanchengensis TaxID=2035833 RepID=A0ABW4YPV5_9BACL
MFKRNKFILLVALVTIALSLSGGQSTVFAAKQYEDGQYTVPFQVLKDGTNEESATSEYMNLSAQVKVVEGKVTANVTLKNSTWWREFKVKSSSGSFADVKVVSENKDNDSRVVSFSLDDIEQLKQAKIHIIVTGIPGFEYDNKYDIQFKFDASKLKEKQEKAEQKPKEQTTTPSKEASISKNSNQPKSTSTTSSANKPATESSKAAGSKSATSESSKGTTDSKPVASESSKATTDSKSVANESSKATTDSKSVVSESTASTPAAGETGNVAMGTAAPDAVSDQSDQTSSTLQEEGNGGDAAATTDDSTTTNTSEATDQVADVTNSTETNAEEVTNEAALEAAAMGETEVEGGKSTKSTTWIWIVVVVVLLAAAGSILYMKKRRT